MLEHSNTVILTQTLECCCDGPEGITQFIMWHIPRHTHNQTQFTLHVTVTLFPEKLNSVEPHRGGLPRAGQSRPLSLRHSLTRGQAQAALGLTPDCRLTGSSGQLMAPGLSHLVLGELITERRQQTLHLSAFKFMFLVLVQGSNLLRFFYSLFL